MRTHSGLHLLSGVVFRDFGALVTGGNMEPSRGPDGLQPARGARRLQGARRGGCAAEVAADRAIAVSTLPRDEAFAIPDIIRTATNLLPPDLEVVRIVDIVGLDTQADGGTHVASTRRSAAARAWLTASGRTGTVNSLVGADRYQTAAQVLTERQGFIQPVATVATGANWPDALSAGGRRGLIFLADPVTGISQSQLDQANTNGYIGEVDLVGGPDVISDQAGYQLQAVLPTYRRLEGRGRPEAGRLVWRCSPTLET